MVNQQLLDYIKQQLQQGIDREQIKNVLLRAGWSKADINEAFVSLDYSNPPSSLEENASIQTFSVFPQQPEQKISKILLAVIFIVGVLIIGSGVFGYFYYFQETPEKIIKKMHVRLAEIKTLEYQGEMKAKITMPNLLPNLLGSDNFMQPTQPKTDKQVSDFSINFNGKFDVSDLNNPKGTLAFNIRTDALKELTQGELTFGLEVQIIDQVIYLRLNNIPNLGFLNLFFDLSFLTNQWIKMDLQVIKEQFGLEEFEKQIKETEKQQELTPEQIKKLRQIVAQTKVFKITEKLPSEKIEGINTHHYRFMIDKEMLKKLIANLMMVGQKETLTEKELPEIISKFDKSLKAIEFIGGEIWIGKKDFLLYKISLTIDLKETTESETAGELITTLLFKNHNKPVQIDIPSPTKEIEEILGELFSRFFGGMKLPEFQPNLELPTH
ncbi:MAG: hypothetical protein QME57_04100 [Patescibacteria group bacterium]|nr:hypothetical protein [Patescibacteria group bacterium]